MAGIAILNAFQIGRLRYDAPMLDRPHIDAIAAKVARIHLPAGALLSVASQPYEGPYGGAELMVTIKISDALFSDVTGRQFTQIVGDLQQHLMAEGEMRFANIDWETDAPPLPQDNEDC